MLFEGIAGLFLGFSLLSGVEIIYYFTMRAGCMIYKNRVCLCSCNLKFMFDIGMGVEKLKFFNNIFFHVIFIQTCTGGALCHTTGERNTSQITI